MMRKIKFPAAILALPMAAFVFAGCKQELPAPVPPEVEVVAIEQRDVPIYSDAVGTLEADVNATISAQVSGYLVSRNYIEGTNVAKGEVLFQIDDRTYKAALDQAKAKQQKSQMDVDRYTPLAKTQAISQQELDDAIQANAANLAAVQQAQLNYDFCTIRSPIDGRAGLAQAQVGDLVGPGTGPLTTVASVNPIRVYFSVAQQIMTQMMEQRVAKGEDLNTRREMPLKLTLSTGAEYQHGGFIRYNDNQVNVKTGTIRVVGVFPNEEGLLLPGMFVRVQAKIGELKNVLIIPQRAVGEIQGRKLVAIVGADNKVSIRPVETGVAEGGMWVVTGPLKPGERVVAEGIQKVREGATVRPVPFGSAAQGQSPAAGQKP